MRSVQAPVDYAPSLGATSLMGVEIPSLFPSLVSHRRFALDTSILFVRQKVLSLFPLVTPVQDVHLADGSFYSIDNQDCLIECPIEHELRV